MTTFYILTWYSNYTDEEFLCTENGCAHGHDAVRYTDEFLLATKPTRPLSSLTYNLWTIDVNSDGVAFGPNRCMW